MPQLLQKKNKKKVRMKDESDDDDEGSHRSLARMGALPPVDGDYDDGFVKRDVDVFSEAPEIDTTLEIERGGGGRSSSSSSHGGGSSRGYILTCAIVFISLPLLIILSTLLVSSAMFASSNSSCSAYEILKRISDLNASEIEAGVERLYVHCSV